MQFGSLSKNLMQKAMRLAGDGAKRIEITYIDGDPAYDPETGASVAPVSVASVRHALVGDFTAQERERYGLNDRVQKVVVARADLARLPEADDTLTVGGAPEVWRVVKVMEDMMQAGVVFAVEQP